MFIHNLKCKNLKRPITFNFNIKENSKPPTYLMLFNNLKNFNIISSIEIFEQKNLNSSKEARFWRRMLFKIFSGSRLIFKNFNST